MNFLSKFFIKFFSIFALLIVFGCQQKPAKIVNRSKVLYNKTNQFNLDKYQNYSKRNSKKITDKSSEESVKINSDHDSSEISQDHHNKKDDQKNIAINSNNSQENFSKNPKDSQNLKNYKETNHQEIIVDNSGETIYSLAKKYQISTQRKMISV
jgi:hypothetical protein